MEGPVINCETSDSEARRGGCVYGGACASDVVVMEADREPRRCAWRGGRVALIGGDQSLRFGIDGHHIVRHITASGAIAIRAEQPESPGAVANDDPSQ